jgi:asparagine synthase (glutamine-hydrolysing)
LQPTDDEIAANFESAIYHADVPLAGSSPISQYFVMKLAASQGVKVLLDGQGSDEYLGGYMHSFYRLIGGYLKSFRPARAMSEWNAHAQLQQLAGKKKLDVLVKSLLSGNLSEQRLYELEYLNYYPFLGNDKSIPFKLDSAKGSRLNQFLYQLTFTTSLPTLLQFEDRNSMAFSIESRVPFLDHRLLEFAFACQDDRKISKGITKRILRESLKGILPEAIVNRTDKKGFVTPGEVKWLRGPLSFLLDADFKNLDFIRSETAKKIVFDFKNGDNSKANLVWRLVVLDYWAKKYT